MIWTGGCSVHYSVMLTVANYNRNLKSTYNSGFLHSVRAFLRGNCRNTNIKYAAENYMYVSRHFNNSVLFQTGFY